MDAVIDRFGRLGRYLVAIILIWLGLTGLLDVGFSSITQLPLIEVDYASEIAYALQIIIGIGIFNRSVKRFAKPIAIVYFLLLGYNFYINYFDVFTPAIPYLSDYGRIIFVEVLMIFSGFSYLRHLK
jgi:hypothetical protein